MTQGQSNQACKLNRRSAAIFYCLFSGPQYLIYIVLSVACVLLLLLARFAFSWHRLNLSHGGFFFNPPHKCCIDQMHLASSLIFLGCLHFRRIVGIRFTKHSRFMWTVFCWIWLYAYLFEIAEHYSGLRPWIIRSLFNRVHFLLPIFSVHLLVSAGSSVPITLALRFSSLFLPFPDSIDFLAPPHPNSIAV